MKCDPKLVPQIVDYLSAVPDHASGTLNPAVLDAIAALVPDNIGQSVETGCGKTTILLSNISERHVVLAVDDRASALSSIRYYEDCPLTRPDRIRLVLGPTQKTLPSFEFQSPIDLALLDGPHAYPFPELEYFYIYPHLREGALLIVDDIHIPTIHRLFEFLAEDDMFELLQAVGTTAFFRRTAAPVFCPTGDGWEHQRFNITRFPVSM